MSSVFTKIISGEFPSYKLFEDEHTFAFLTKDAIHPGHSLIVPKKEVDYFVEVPEPYYSKVFENARLLSQAIHRATGCTRVGALIAGWEVPHFHLHLVPMFDEGDLDLKKGKERTPKENEEIQTKILASLKNGPVKSG